METSTEIAPLQPRPVKGKDLPSPKEKLLTKKQLSFCDNLERGLNDFEAAINAGYTPLMAEQASITIRKSATVQKELYRRGIQYYQDSGAKDPDYLLSKLALIAESNISDYYKADVDPVTGKTFFVLDLGSCSRDQKYAIKSIKTDALGRQYIELYDKPKTVETLVKVRIAQKEAERNPDAPLTIQDLDSLIQKVTNVQVNIYGSKNEQEVGKEQNYVEYVDSIATEPSAPNPVALDGSNSAQLTP